MIEQDSATTSKRTKKPIPPPVPPPGPGPVVGQPIFAQPKPSPNPGGFRTPVTDQKEFGLKVLGAVPEPRGGKMEPVLTLAQVYGAAGEAKVAELMKAGQIVFHSVGDTGDVHGPQTQSLVADKMVADFHEPKPEDVPSFFFHLGDVVYYFGEPTYYYDQFYEPYRDYPAPILAVAGNHDGVVYARDPNPTLQGFLENFCTAKAGQAQDAGGLLRSTMIQPGVYFTFEAPFVRVLALYSNVLEDPGVISDQGGTMTALDGRQVAYLTAALQRAKAEHFTGAMIVAVHHPPITGGATHGGSPLMLADIDAAAKAAGMWPHAIFSGHAHNYQRFTRTVNGLHVAHLVAGCGGHSPLSKMKTTYRTPYVVDATLTLENYDDGDFGYLRVVVNAKTMTVEFHPQSDGGTTKTPNDVVTIDLATHTVK